MDNLLKQSFIVYLSGSMIEDKPEHREWRKKATELLAVHDIDVRNPYRGRNKDKIMKVDGYHYVMSNAPISSRLGNILVARDYKDVEDANALLVYLRGTKDQRPSIGTLAELAWAYQLHKPVICVVHESDTQKDYYRHPFMHTFVSQWTSTVEEAVDAIVNYWHPDARLGD